MNYFFLADRIKPKTAFICAKNESYSFEDLEAKVIKLDKDPIQFEFLLKHVTLKNGEIYENEDLSAIKHLWVDYQPNNFAWPFMSEKMKLIVEAHLTGKECIDWVSTDVRAGEEIRNYYIPRFNKKLDVLDMDKTLFVDGTDRVIRPVFSSKKILEFTLFTAPSTFWKITSGLYINETLRKALEKEKLTGVAFENTSVSYD